MFTGIIKAMAPIACLEKKYALTRYAVSLPEYMLAGLECGTSISVDGVCQTVVDIDEDKVWFEAISETLNKTTFLHMHLGSLVNIERSAKIGDEIGGHLLSGHIYGTAEIASIKENIYTFQCPPHWMKYLFSKGFIAIDGISLTLVNVDKKRGNFSVHLIPETLKRTTLGRKREGDCVNLEFDAMTQATVETIENFLNAK
jgi:riboflavin synthase